MLIRLDLSPLSVLRSLQPEPVGPTGRLADWPTHHVPSTDETGLTSDRLHRILRTSSRLCSFSSRIHQQQHPTAHALSSQTRTSHWPSFDQCRIEQSVLPIILRDVAPIAASQQASKEASTPGSLSNPQRKCPEKQTKDNPSQQKHSMIRTTDRISNQINSCVT